MSARAMPTGSTGRPAKSGSVGCFGATCKIPHRQNCRSLPGFKCQAATNKWRFGF